ncbi:MAG: hypothetical protein HXX10_08380 [Rhodoplanes sp.]|uniref:hypothetical protein n=1 Tax=Rhodoplanes sp. TaxID=1968906 RepID=UPI00185331E0|nr:hypothetical protein [Rhodoplanes sp.]NVO14039.1 hypothetical protein [Rhodoplanes sp.]
MRSSRRLGRLLRAHVRIVSGLAAGAVLAVAIGIAWLPSPGSPVRSSIGPEGTIRLAPDPHKQCQRLGFDNRNGEFRDRGVSACEPADADTTAVDRMQAVRAWFNRGAAR